MLAALLLASAPSDFRIVPGERIGKVRLGAPASSLSKLGRPSGGDSAMGKSFVTWLGRSGHRLDVFESLTPDASAGKVILAVRVTSPRFRTTAGLGPGCSEQVWRRAYPAANDLTSYRPPSGGAPIHLFSDAKRGIAFEVVKGRCLAVSVQQKGDDMAGVFTGYLDSPLPRVR